MRAMIIALALAAAGCAPGPTPMAATEASEILTRFAAGAAPADICTPQGRALQRGAVRAYGAEMVEAGVPWPASPALGVAPDDLSSVDVAVLVALSTGFIEASDLRGRALAMRSPFEQWPEVRRLRNAARVACEEVARVQQAAVQFVLEAERYRWLAAHADRDALAAERIDRQARRMERAQARLQIMASAFDARAASSRTGG